jgi:hypothetical protein
MSLAASPYPLLNLFWTMFIFFLWVVWIWILITVFIDHLPQPGPVRLGQGPVVPVRAVHPAHRRAGLPDRPRRLDARAGGRAGRGRVMTAAGIPGARQWLVIRPIRPR